MHTWCSCCRSTYSTMAMAMQRQGKTWMVKKVNDVSNSKQRDGEPGIRWEKNEINKAASDRASCSGEIDPGQSLAIYILIQQRRVNSDQCNERRISSNLSQGGQSTRPGCYTNDNWSTGWVDWTGLTEHVPTAADRLVLVRRWRINLSVDPISNIHNTGRTTGEI